MADGPNSGMLGCSFLFWAVLIACCAGVITCDSRMRSSDCERQVKQKMTWVDQNKQKGKVLYVYTMRNNKGHFIGYSAVVEGIQTQGRIEVPLGGALPVPGEIWEIGVVNHNNHVVQYYFVRKID